ncbi:MAG: hypothetical protein ACI82A_000569 [Candidatus Azotimanducaceae bacterium]
MKLANQQLIAADASKIRPKPESRGSDPVKPVDAVSRVVPGSSYDQNKFLPKPFSSSTPNNLQVVNFYQHTASLDAEPGELIGIDTYA